MALGADEILLPMIQRLDEVETALGASQASVLLVSLHRGRARPVVLRSLLLLFLGWTLVVTVLQAPVWLSGGLGGLVDFGFMNKGTYLISMQRPYLDGLWEDVSRDLAISWGNIDALRGETSFPPSVLKAGALALRLVDLPTMVLPAIGFLGLLLVTPVAGAAPYLEVKRVECE